MLLGSRGGASPREKSSSRPRKESKPTSHSTLASTNIAPQAVVSVSNISAEKRVRIVKPVGAHKSSPFPRPSDPAPKLLGRIASHPPDGVQKPKQQDVVLATSVHLVTTPKESNNLQNGQNLDDSSSEELDDDEDPNEEWLSEALNPFCLPEPTTSPVQTSPTDRGSGPSLLTPPAVNKRNRHTDGGRVEHSDMFPGEPIDIQLLTDFQTFSGKAFGHKSTASTGVGSHESCATINQLSTLVSTHVSANSFAVEASIFSSGKPQASVTSSRASSKHASTQIPVDASRPKAVFTQTEMSTDDAATQTPHAQDNKRGKMPAVRHRLGKMFKAVKGSMTFRSKPNQIMTE